jgi:hypothetical protein
VSQMPAECENQGPLRRLAVAGSVGSGGGADKGPRLDRHILKRLGGQLAAQYGDPGADAGPARFHELLAALDERARSSPTHRT